ncbi:MAG: hypothetical protein E7256_05545 [Lachnospiraceae bacterium]|nr:hypothetical protein [Lachnospiraceae bacterium]
MTQPSTYEIKLQDTELYVVPGVQGRFDICFETGTILEFFTGSFPISSTHTIDNGIATIGTGTGSKSPYWNGSAHGVHMYNENYLCNCGCKR